MFQLGDVFVCCDVSVGSNCRGSEWLSGVVETPFEILCRLLYTVRSPSNCNPTDNRAQAQYHQDYKDDIFKSSVL